METAIDNVDHWSFRLAKHTEGSVDLYCVVEVICDANSNVLSWSHVTLDGFSDREDLLGFLEDIKQDVTSHDIIDLPDYYSLTDFDE